MDPSLRKQLLDLAGVAFVFVAVFAAVKFRRLPFRETLGLFIPNAKSVAFWIGLYIPIFIASEAIYFGLGLQQGRVWEYQGLVTIIRIVKIALLGPISEELLFRGLMFDRISNARPGPIAAVIFTAVIFAAMHFSYSIVDILLVLVDGLYFGWVRYKTGSIFIPIILHIFINSESIIEALFINAHL